MSPDKHVFTYEQLRDNEAVSLAVNDCEGKHVQQVVYSSFMRALTQICFTCQKIRGVIQWDGNKSWRGSSSMTRKTDEEVLWELWKSLWDKHENTEVEYDEATGCMLVRFAAEVSRRAVDRTLDEALNSGDGSYRP